MDELSGTSPKKGNADSSDLIEACSECGSESVVEDLSRGEKVCGECGLVLSDHRIDTGAEWRAFSSEESDARSRVG
ncbi:MAG: TFIIB-type zinc ribbon-containing protein, partial [Candidatus Thorarchaeota archaeon]